MILQSRRCSGVAASGNASHASGSNSSTNASSLPSVVCFNDNNAVFSAAVSRVVNDEIFPKKQFIVLEQELDVHGKLAKKCLQALQMEPSQWYSIKEVIRKRLNRKRNNALLGVRRKLLSYMEQHGPDSIELRRVLLGRKDRETFHWFLDNIASVVVGAVRVEHLKSTKLPNEWLPRSLEAFCLLCVENYFAKVQMETRNEGNSNVGKPLWTCDARGKKKNQGWSQDGIRRYNHLIQSVRLDRETHHMEDVIYLNQKKDEKKRLEMERLQRRQELTAIRERGWEAAEDDFSSDSDSE